MTLISNLRQGPARLGWSAIPALMRAGVLFSSFAAAMILLFVPLSALNVGSYSINERVVTGPYFLTHVYPILAPYLVIALAISYGIWTERPWVRPLSLLFWLALDLGLLYEIAVGWVRAADAFVYAVWGVVYVLIVWWYFYRKTTVVSYYRKLVSASLPTAAGA